MTRESIIVGAIFACVAIVLAMTSVKCFMQGGEYIIPGFFAFELIAWLAWIYLSGKSSETYHYE
jgi:hypothetical protein